MASKTAFSRFERFRRCSVARVCSGAAVLVAALLFLATPALAQYGQIEGQVIDATGAVLPGATVTAVNEGTGVPRSSVSDAGGDYRLPGLQPGTYTVTAALTGFQTVQTTGVILTIQQTIVMDQSLSLAQVEETVTVTGDGAAARHAAFGHLDIGFRSADPGSPGGLPPLGGPRAAHSGDEPGRDPRLLLPRQREHGRRGPLLRERLHRGRGEQHLGRDGRGAPELPDGRHRRVPGHHQQLQGGVRARHRRPHDRGDEVGHQQLRGKRLLVLPRQIVDRADLPAEGIPENASFEKPAYRRHQWGGSFGGPIVEDRTHFFFAYERTIEELFYDINTGGVHPQFEGSFPKDEWRYMWLGRLNHQLSEDHSVWLRIAWENEYRPNLTAGGSRIDGFDFAVPRNAEVLGITSVTGANSLNEFRFQRAFSKYEVSEAFSHGSWDPGDFNAERLALCEQDIRRPTLRMGSCNDQMGPETRWQFKDDFTWFTQGMGGDHQVKFGVDYNWIDFAADSVGGYSGRFNFDTDEPFDPNNPDTHPIQYTQRQPVFDRVPVHHFSIYTQDDWTSERLTLNLGLRYDLQVGPMNEDIGDIQFPLPIPWHEGADARGDKNNFGPRIGFVYDLSRDNTGRTTVKGGYGKFFENIRTLTNFGERWWHQGQSIVINNPDFLDPLGGRSREEYLSSAPPNITVLDNDYEQPYAHHFNLGVAHQFRDDMALSLDLTRVATRADAQRNINLNYAVDGVRPWSQFRNVNATYSLLDHDYQAFYAKFEKRYAGGWQFLVSYTLAKSDTTEFWTRNVDPSGWDSRFPGYTRVTHPGGTDRRHRLVSSAILVLPGDIRVSAILDYRSPLPVR